MARSVDDLFNDFPNLFRRGGARNGGCWEVAIGDGWLDLVYDLSARISEIVNAMPPDEAAAFRVVQIKEKFGDLRFYIDATTEEISNLISKAAADATRICCICGKSGYLQGEGWDERVLCVEHGYGSPTEKLADYVDEPPRDVHR